MITIHAMSAQKSMDTSFGTVYKYREEIGQKTFSGGWDFRDAYEFTRSAYPDADIYSVRICDGLGGCTTGWERNCAAGY